MSLLPAIRMAWSSTSTTPIVERVYSLRTVASPVSSLSFISLVKVSIFQAPLAP
jgi:hypothetical protein